MWQVDGTVNATEQPFQSVRRASFRSARVGFVISPRLVIYFACAAAAVIANYLLGKDMMWDTLDYHLYAGFSALHDRFSQDYFAAGPQSYFNPYVYVPFYLLARSGMSALMAASILAIAQSGLLWLTYEIATAIVASETPGKRIAIGVCAVALAFANPIVIAELGSSYSDITTAALVLAAWLLLASAVGAPRRAMVLCAGLMLGVVSALKATNAAHTLSAFVLLLFMPITWRARIRWAALFTLALGLGFLLVALPWALELQRHFGNPVFPLLNDVFRSPQYTTGSALDYRFIPDSLASALWRPFAIAAPMGMVDSEYPSPDLRYAVLLILAVLVLLRWAVLLLRASRSPTSLVLQASGRRMLAALGCGFLLDWILWLTVSGNGRYFIAMACIAAVLVVVLAFRLFEANPRLRNYLIGAVMGVQAVQLAIGAGYRVHVPWDGGQWFEISMPKSVSARPTLYFLFGNLSNAFLAPFLASGSAFINVGGVYELGSGGVMGLRIRSLIQRYEPNIRVVAIDSRRDAGRSSGPPDLTLADDELGRFGLRADRSTCSRIVVEDTAPTETLLGSPSPSTRGMPPLNTSYLAACGLVPGPAAPASFLDGERSANLVFDRLEDACPRLFRPRHPQTRNVSDPHLHIWARQYPGTGLMVYLASGGRVLLRALDRGGPPEDLGAEREWLAATAPRVTCGRRDERYYVTLLQRGG
jgi:hypothetical protein